MEEHLLHHLFDASGCETLNHIRIISSLTACGATREDKDVLGIGHVTLCTLCLYSLIHDQ